VDHIHGLIVGTAAHNDDVATDGVVSEAFEWDRRADTVEQLHLVGPDENFITFYLRSNTEEQVAPFAFSTQIRRRGGRAGPVGTRGRGQLHR
jgi:hypothetical protein